MQNIALIGEHACEIALNTASAFDTPPAGYVLMPFAVNGHEKGEILHLLQPVSGEKDNDIPCVLHVENHGNVLVPEVFELVAAKALRYAINQRTLIVLGGITKPMLALQGFCDAVKACLQSHCGTILCTEEDALPALRNMCNEMQLYTTDEPDVSLLMQNELFYGG